MGGTNAAEQTQLLQQQQFLIASRNYDIGRGGITRRFPDGKRPIQMCKNQQIHGMCRRGDECAFGHSYDELHPASAELHASQDAGAKVFSALAEQEEPSFLNGAPSMQMKKKRDICQRMNRSGCLLNERCMFAHSEEELGKVALVITEERVKRVLCKLWDSSRCGYGKYCVNAHGMGEIGKLKPPEELCPSGPIRTKAARLATETS